RSALGAGEILALSLHDALPILPSASPNSEVGSTEGTASRARRSASRRNCARRRGSRASVGGSSFRATSTPPVSASGPVAIARQRSEEHTSELQSRENLVCRLLL